MIEVHELVKRYGTFDAVKGITFDVAAGEVFGLLGPNGAGKTSTLSMISCLHAPTSGTIRIAGLDIRTQTQAVKSCVGVVPQELALYPTLTARDNLLFFGAIYGLHGKTLQARMEEVLDVVGLRDRALDVVDTFSGGMKRRLNLACGLLHRPKVLLLDEPTVGVDPQSRNLIFENIRQLNTQYKMTVIYTTHYMEEAETLCARVAIMDQGKLIACDTPRELIRHYGDGTIELKTSALKADLAPGLRKVAHVNEVTQVENTLHIRSNKTYTAIVDVLALLKSQGVELEALHIQEASLENVFLKLTGKSLRDQALVVEATSEKAVNA